MEVEVLEEVNKLREEEEGANRVCWEGGPTKLPEKGGGQHQRPGKEEPLVGRRQEGASDHHCLHCWSLFLVGFLHPVRWHPPDNGRQCGGKVEQQVGQRPSQLAVRHCLHHPHLATQAGWRRRRGRERSGRSPRYPLHIYCKGGQDGGLGGHQLEGGGK